jgi:hypothetical protein
MPPVPPPMTSHAARLNALADKVETDGVQIQDPKIMHQEIVVDPEVLPSGERATGGAPSVEVTPPATSASSTPASEVSDRGTALRRSANIARRAEAAQRRARAEASKLRAKRAAESEALAASSDVAKSLAQREEAAAAKERSIRDVEARLNDTIELLKRDPMEFARRAGMSSADFAKASNDPVGDAIARVRADARAEIAKIRTEFQTELQSVKAETAASRTAAAQAEFYAALEEGKFDAALMVYSPEEQWAKANELAQKADRLRYDWDRDRLLEEVNTAAKKDPRWSRIKARLAPNQTPPNAKPTNPANAPAQEPKPKPRRDAQPATPRGSNGQFQNPKTTPMQRHNQRVASILRVSRG